MNLYRKTKGKETLLGLCKTGIVEGKNKAVPSYNLDFKQTNKKQP